MHARWLAIILLCLYSSWVSAQKLNATRAASENSVIKNQPNNIENNKNLADDEPYWFWIACPLKPDKNTSDKCAARYYDYKNLNAYEKAADAANKQLIAAIAAISFTFLGTILLWRTLHHTRRSADAAKGTLEATLRTERPYLFISPVPIVKSEPPKQEGRTYLQNITYSIAEIEAEGSRRREGKKRFNYEIFNHGKTPAIIRSIGVLIERYDTLPLVPPPIHMDESETGKVVAASAATKPKLFSCAKGFGEDQNVFVIGRILYEDVAGNECETGFCFRFIGEQIYEQSGNKKYNYRK